MALNILISSSYEKVPLYVPTPTEDILMLGFEINFFFDKENYFLIERIILFPLYCKILLIIMAIIYYYFSFLIVKKKHPTFGI
jgi:hypothetical protein